MFSLPRGRVRGEVRVPGDKSISHRALIFRAFARGGVRIENLNDGLDVRATRRGLAGLQRAETNGAAFVDCANSGSTARMLLGVCAGSRIRARFDGDRSLRRRPMEPVAAQLRAFGARIETSGGRLPAEIVGFDRVQTRDFILLAPSAQVKTALLFAGLFANVAVSITGDAGSRDHTERLLRYQGATIDWDGSSIRCAAPPVGRRPIHIPGDFSSAAFFITAAAIAPGSNVLLCGVGVNPTRTGLLDGLVRMGADVEIRNRRDVCGEPVADIVARYAPLRAARLDGGIALRAIDEIPLLAIAAAFANGESHIAGISSLREKESDRVASIERLLRAVGIRAQHAAGGIAIHGGAPSWNGVPVQTRNDHRMAMAASVLAAGAGPVAIDDVASADVSFPEFEKTFRSAIEPVSEAKR